MPGRAVRTVHRDGRRPGEVECQAQTIHDVLPPALVSDERGPCSGTD